MQALPWKCVNVLLRLPLSTFEAKVCFSPIASAVCQIYRNLTLFCDTNAKMKRQSQAHVLRKSKLKHPIALARTHIRNGLLNAPRTLRIAKDRIKIIFCCPPSVTFQKNFSSPSKVKSVQDARLLCENEGNKRLGQNTGPYK